MVIHQSMRDIEGYLSPKQIELIINNTVCKRDRMMCLMLWYTGRRVSEVLKVKKKHIDWQENKILFNILKKRKTHEKWKVVPQKLIQILNQYCIDLENEKYLFESPYIQDQPISRSQAYRVIRDAAENAGIFRIGEKPVHPHVFRHSFAVHYIKHMNSPSALRLLQQYLEHSDISTTSVYLQFGEDEIEKDLNTIF